jgi:hypothetical protein
MKRIAESGGAFEVRLLRAARGESSPSHSKERAAAAAAAIAIAAGAGCGAELAFGTKIWKLLGLMVGGGAICVGATLIRPVPALAPDEAIAPRASSAVEDVSPHVLHDAEEPAATEAPPPRKPLRTPPPPIDVPSEIALVRRAKTELSAHDPSAALATLDERARLFPHGAFAEEADALRIHALAARGDAVAARAAAARFSSTYPRSPYAERIRSIVGP